MQLSRVKDEFLFTIESTGILSPEELFKEALKVGICSKDMRLEDDVDVFDGAAAVNNVVVQVLTDKCATVAAVLQGQGGAE